MMLYLDYDGLKRYHNLSLNEFVFRESGKGLSTNDYTDAEKTKLAGISENATNVTESTISEWGFIKSDVLTNKADLVDGVVPSDQLPSFVDDIVEFNKISSSAPATCSKGDYYYNNISNKIYKATDTDTWGATTYDPEKSKIYFDKNELKSYRWTGSTMLEIHDAISIGTSTGTAADGKIVNDHINASNPHSGSQSKITAIGILKSDGNGNISTAIVGDDYLAPLVFNTTPTDSNKVATMSDIPSWALQSSRPDYSFNDLITHPTTISGYGITDAKIESGTITLGSSTLTPLTSSSLNGYATLSWVGNQGFASQSSLSHYLALTGGTMENTIITPGSDDYGIYPESNRSGFIGKNTNWYWKIYGSLLYSEKMELYNYNNESRSLYGGIDNNNFYLYPDTNSYKFNVNEFGYVTALKFTKEGGTSSQFLKADGSVDSNTYLTSLSLTNYVLKSNTTGFLKNDGTIDSNTYLTSSSLNDYATKQWVGLGYVSNSSIGDMATKTWVGEQDFVSFDSQGDISLQGDVNAGIFNATGGFKKSGSSNSYVLLAGGGTKPLTDFAASNDSKVTSIGMSVPTGFQVTGSPITSSGTLVLSFSSGYTLPTTSDVSKGVTAYGWGNHADAGYLTSSSLNSYATQQWVSSGYVPNSAISDMATKTWVTNQNYIVPEDNGNVSVEQDFTARYDIISSMGGFKISGSSNSYVLLAGGGTKTLSDFITSSGGTLTNTLQAFPYTVSNSTYYRIKVEDTNGITINGRRLFIGNSYLQITNSGGGSVTQQADGDTYKFTANPNSGGQSGVTSFLFNKDITAEGILSLKHVSGNATYNSKQWFNIGSSGMFYHFGCYDQNNNGMSADILYDFEGTIRANNVSTSSDSRLKNIITYEEFKAEQIAELPLVKYSWKNDKLNRLHFGSVAQEWLKVLPEVITEDNNKMLAMNYGAAAMAAGVTACREIVEMKELMKAMLKEIKILKEEIEELKRR